jgi:signal transduction histidine kinase
LEEFAGIVSHDLKNPLNVASGRIKLAQEECDSEHLDSVAEAHEHMGELIEDLLALSRQGKWTGEREPVNLQTMSINCWQTVTGTEPSIRIETEKQILADPTALRQVFGNVFTNAVQHAGPKVTITVGELPDGFYIEDDGPGIPKTERDNVFEPRHSIVEDGTGFGLTIVKQVIEAHGWDIRIVEGGDGGTRFEITGVEIAE